MFIGGCFAGGNMPDELTHANLGSAIEVHRILGPGLLESIYEEALCEELSQRGIPYRRQVAVDVWYKDKVIKGQRLDLLVNEEVIVEIKSLSVMPEYVTTQALSYLKATGLKRALIINFGQKTLIKGVRRISL